MKITLQHISKAYTVHGKPKGGVSNIDLDIGHQEFITLMGPSGAGKSTILHLISGALFPDQGQILFDGQDMTRVPPEERPVHTVFQGLHLFPNMSVEGNIAFALEQSKTPPSQAEIHERVNRLLKQVGLEGYNHRGITQLSGGEKQRVAIARSLIDHPQALLLDEPFAPLDRTLKESLIELILAIKREAGITIVLTTHDWYEALRLSDRIAVVRQGGLAQVGTPQELYFKPRTLSIARITGPMNVIEQDGALYGIRPAFVQLAPGSMSGTVEEILFAGNMHHVRVRVNPNLLIHVETPTAPARGETVSLHFPKEHLIRLERDHA